MRTCNTLYITTPPFTLVPSQKAKASASPKKTSKAKATKAKSPKKPAVKPVKAEAPLFDRFEGAPNSLEGMAFVITGELGSMSREEAEDYIKMHGGRVTGSVSGKTTYLLMGEQLEDGRATTDGSKYKKANDQPERTTLLESEYEMFGLVKMLHEKANGAPWSSPSEAPASVAAPAPVPPPAPASSAAAPSNPYAKKVAPSNPYVKVSAAPSNPYAKSASAGASSNPYAKSASSTPSNPYAKKPAAASSSSTFSTTAKPSGPLPGGGRAKIDDKSALWADKYAPSELRHILGNGGAVKNLTNWINNWEATWNSGSKPNKSAKRAALLSGPPGIGKTTTATLVAQACGRHVLEKNASDARSKKALSESMGDILGTQVLNFGGKKTKQKKRVLIMDEVWRGGAGRRDGMN